MSGDVFGPIVVPENIIRDWLQTVVNAGNYGFSCSNVGVIGLDIYLNNQGAAAITLALDGRAAITIAAGAVFAISSTRFSLVTIVAAVNYDLMIAGVKISTLKAKGVID